mmetsp:Transcript_37791/g.72402  ORF Transcript_37791/g.72402 Transcript_37791/m.72402 type:complete len:320 (+) Transcript_37791:344-1303(+)
MTLRNCLFSRDLHQHGDSNECKYRACKHSPSQGVRGRENDPGYKGSNPCCYGLKATIQRIHSGAVSFRNELNHVRFHHSVHWGERHGSHSEPYEHLPLLTYSKEQIERYKLAETAHQYDCRFHEAIHGACNHVKGHICQHAYHHIVQNHADDLRSLHGEFALQEQHCRLKQCAGGHPHQDTSSDEQQQLRQLLVQQLGCFDCPTSPNEEYGSLCRKLRTASLFHPKQRQRQNRYSYHGNAQDCHAQPQGVFRVSFIGLQNVHNHNLDEQRNELKADETQGPDHVDAHGEALRDSQVLLDLLRRVCVFQGRNASLLLDSA